MESTRSRYDRSSVVSMTYTERAEEGVAVSGNCYVASLARKRRSANMSRHAPQLTFARRRRLICFADRQESGSPTDRQCPGADIQYLKSLGVDEVVDYKRERFEDKATGINAVVDLVAGETLARSYAVAKNGGVLATTVQPIDQSAAKRAGIRAVQVIVTRKAAEL